MLSVTDIPEVIQRNIKPRQPIFMAPGEALGLVSASDLRSPADLPSFSVALAEGFAVYAHNLSRGATHLDIVGVSAPEVPFTGNMTSGQCLAVKAGARVPVGPNCIVPADIALASVGESIKLEGPVEKGQNISLAGSMVKRGSLLVIERTLITPQRVAAAMAVGTEKVAVFPPPKVAILVSAAGMVEPNESRKEGYLHNYCWTMLSARFEELSLRQVEFRGLIAPAEIDWKKILREATKADITIVAGVNDLVEKQVMKEKLAQIGWETLIDGIDCIPGGEVFAAKNESGAIFFQIGSANLNLLTALGEVVQPTVGRMMGLPLSSPTIIKARLVKSLVIPSGEGVRFMLGRLIYRQGEAYTLPIEYSSVDDLSAGAQACGAFLVADTGMELAKDTMVEFHLWRELL